MAGIGRGGRGRALLDAINQPVRKPGVVGASETENASQTPQQAKVEALHGVLVVTLLCPSQVSQPGPVTAVQPPVLTSPAALGFPLGRGVKGPVPGRTGAPVEVCGYGCGVSWPC
jgi:hypothetical protein